MSDCTDTCILSYDGDGDRADFYSAEIRKAAKAHECCECEEFIQPGERYEHTSGKWDGELGTYKTCLLCVEIRTKFSCGEGWLFCCMWDDLREYLFDHLRFECLDGLSVPAREKVLSAWRKWKDVATGTRAPAHG